MYRRSIVLAVSAAILFPAIAADVNTRTSPAPTPEQERELLKDVKVPDGFSATIFAVPPAVNYPVFVAAEPDGTLYVSSDRNGSLDRAANRGRVLRVKDLDGDGHADEVKQFVPNVDSPRGLVWDRDRLYLMHPPNLSAFIDRDGDGVADEEKVLVKNIAFGFKDRPADHSSNGLELGVDGWIYCAIGDFGFMQAEGADGTKMQLRGGGVVRVRPDGSGLELYSSGTRNILEAAVSPTLEIFARDNTNDGDGWDIRLHHFSALSYHGYPSLFKHFPGEFIEPLADYGGGSGCGSLFLSEPGFPSGFNNALYTADWGREWVYRHQLTSEGASFKVNQTEFVRAPRVTDLDVDGMSRLYVSSWKGATFTYVGEDVGFLLEVKPNGFKPEALPDFKKDSETDLIKVLESPSHRRRLAAQRELIARHPSSKVLDVVERLAADTSKKVETRIAALFLLKQAAGTESHAFIQTLLDDPKMAAYAVRALCDNPGETANVQAALVLKALKNPDPRVRWEAAFGITRLKAPKAADALTGLLGDPDATVAHTAMRALRKMEASEACFTVLDSPGSSEAERKGALRVLQALHKPEIVDGLMQRLKQPHSMNHRHQLITALCRLYYTDGEWKGDSWGTRPDTTGPYYQPVEWSETGRIDAFLQGELKKSAGEDAVFLVKEFSRHKIQNEETLAMIVDLAGKDASLLPDALVQLARADRLPAGADRLVRSAAEDASTDPVARAHAIMALVKIGDENSERALLKAMAALYATDHGKEANQARQEFLRSRKAEKHLAMFRTEAAKLDEKTSPWADAVLLSIESNKNASAAARKEAGHAIDEGWKDPARRAQILKAIALAENRASKERVLDALNDSNPAVAEAARATAHTLRFDRERKIERSPLVGSLKPEETVRRVSTLHGDLKLGAEVFNRQTCNTCHTTSQSEALRGPFLGNIATIYKRDELATAILLPNKTIAQGFTTHHFELKDGTDVDGFVVQEGAEQVKVRNVAAQEIDIKVSDIASRKRLETSIMPEGLVANLNLKEFASLLDYLQSLSKQ